MSVAETVLNCQPAKTQEAAREAPSSDHTFETLARLAETDRALDAVPLEENLPADLLEQNWDLFFSLLESPPTTPEGIAAALAYAADWHSTYACMVDDRPIVEIVCKKLGAAAAAIMGDKVPRPHRDEHRPQGCRLPGDHPDAELLRLRQEGVAS